MPLAEKFGSSEILRKRMSVLGQMAHLVPNYATKSVHSGRFLAASFNQAGLEIKGIISRNVWKVVIANG